MQALVVFNSTSELYDLIIEINNKPETISTSKNYGHWQYHLSRGTLSKTVSKYGITSFEYSGFLPGIQPVPTTQTQSIPAPIVNCVETSNWFSTQALQSSGKKRGRPRKYLPQVSGVTTHKMSDDEPSSKILTSKNKEDLERNFKVFSKSMNNQKALSEVSLKFNIPYKQVYEVVANLL